MYWVPHNLHISRGVCFCSFHLSVYFHLSNMFKIVTRHRWSFLQLCYIEQEPLFSHAFVLKICYKIQVLTFLTFHTFSGPEQDVCPLADCPIWFEPVFVPVECQRDTYVIGSDKITKCYICPVKSCGNTD
jgi:hypothetical protein